MIVLPFNKLNVKHTGMHKKEPASGQIIYFCHLYCITITLKQANLINRKSVNLERGKTSAEQWTEVSVHSHQLQPLCSTRVAVVKRQVYSIYSYMSSQYILIIHRWNQNPRNSLMANTGENFNSQTVQVW